MADYNLRFLCPLARYVEDTFGADGLREMTEAGRVPREHFDGKDHWVSAGTFEALLAAARARMRSDEEFKQACVHRIKEAYGPLRYVVWAVSPHAVYAASIDYQRLVLRSSPTTLVGRGRTWIRVRIEPTVDSYSRLNCLLRQAQSAALPTLWGLPPAYCHEHACAARGDEACDLELHWYDRSRWFPAAVGAALFACLGLVLMRAGLAHTPSAIALTLLGGTLAHLLEMRRADRLNARTREEVVHALRQLADAETDARREQQVRASTLLGVSHDLRTPLQIIQMSAEYLRCAPGIEEDADAVASLDDIREAVERMRRLVGGLVQATKAEHDLVLTAPQRVQTAGLADALRRRLRALVHGREVRTSVLVTRDAPEALEIDPLALDRVLDNLLTNAAKYTDRGSIGVELGGAPGQLVIQISDTGRGMDPGALDRVVEPVGPAADGPRGDSSGLGLSVVSQLLGQMGGRIEVKSKPGSGTTFWVRLPLAPRPAEPRASVLALRPAQP